MSFVDAKFSKWGEVATAVFSQSLAKRLARVMLAAVLAASFLPVVAFADDNAISGPNQIKYYMTAQYTNGTSRSEYNWDWSSTDGGKIEISYLDGLYPDHERVSVTGTEVGSVILTVSGGDKPSESITITIGKRDVRLSSMNDSKTYDGRPLTGGISVDGDGWAPIDEGRVQFNTTSRTNAGESENMFDVVLPSGSEEYFEEHYNLIITRYGVLTVEKRPVTLTSASDSKEYDGKPLTNHKVTVGEAAWGTGWVDGQGATYSFTGSQKIVGSSENAFECIPNEGTNLDNYQINKTYGTLTVTDRGEKYQITLTPNSKSVTYDGTEKSVSGFETLEFQINGQTFYVSGVEASATGTDAGEYPVTKSGQAVVTDVEGNDVTEQFIVNIDDAKLTIVEGEPAQIDSNEPSSSTPSKTTGKTAASKLAKTGDSAAPYAMGICGVAITAGAVAFVARRKGSSRR